MNVKIMLLAVYMNVIIQKEELIVHVLQDLK